jgi:release factor glutamine methyltransferase
VTGGGDPAAPAATRAVTMRAAVDAAAALLAEAGVPSPRADALALAAHAAGTDTLVLALAPPADPAFLARLAGLVERRRRREPLQHILGWMPFRHLRLLAGPGTFVARPETEVVAGAAIEEAAALAAGGAEPVVVDLCTGSGAIALAVATEVPASRVHAVELSPAALATARRNADAVGPLRHPLDLRLGDAAEAFHDLDGRVDVVVANPPYVPPDAVPTDPEVRDHDPALALYGGGADGLDVARGVVAAAGRLLRPGGLLVMEHADVQGAAVRDVVRGAGAFLGPVTAPDLTGRDRMVLARRAAPGAG